MKGSILNKHKELKAQTDKIPTLVNMIRDKNNGFIKSLEKWMLETEKVLTKYNYPECSEIAGLRSRIYLPKYTSANSRNVKKEQMSVSTELIYSAQNMIYHLVQNLDEKINEAKDMLTELIEVAMENGIIKIDKNTDFNNYINSLVAYFKTHEQLKSLIQKPYFVLGRTDTIRLMAEYICKAV
ncbi:MAG: hypothetical protein ACPGUH_04445 [Winogradskyella sp.]